MRTYTRDEVEEVVKSLVGGHPPLNLRDAITHTPSMSWDACAREVLRRLDALPASAPPSPARGVPEGFAGTLDHVLADVRYGGDGPESHVHQLRLLMFRFPDGSLAPHVEAVEGAPYAGECLMELTTLVHLMRNVGQVEAFQIGNRDVPNPPAAPESSLDIDNLSGESPAVQLVRLAAEAGLPVRFVQRPRMVTPPPNTPVLKAECGHVLEGRPPGSARATCRKAPHGDDLPHRWDEDSLMDVKDLGAWGQDVRRLLAGIAAHPLVGSIYQRWAARLGREWDTMQRSAQGLLGDPPTWAHRAPPAPGWSDAASSVEPVVFNVLDEELQRVVAGAFLALDAVEPDEANRWRPVLEMLSRGVDEYLRARGGNRGTKR